jgi:hypothetical protein
MVATLPVALVAFSVLLHSAPAPKPPNQDTYDAADKNSVRSNGALLTASVSVEETKDGPAIHVSWSLDYKGPRQPLVIYTPSLAVANSGTRVHFFAEDAKSKLYHGHVTSCPPPLGPLIFGKLQFMTVKAGEAGTGKLVIPVDKVRATFGDRLQALGESPTLRLQLFHEPTERGKRFDLDAWTGELCSKVLLVPLKKW